MTFHWPGSLWGLLPVLAAGLWALRRPVRQDVTVGSLELWRKATAALTRTDSSPTRRANVAWALLLAGAVAAVLTTANPAIQTSPPSRSVAAVVVPSAEISGTVGMSALRSAVGRWLDRLGENDRVTLALPAVLGGESGPMSPADARAKVAAIPALPARADELLPPEPTGCGRVYYFAAAGASISASPTACVVEIPTDLSDAMILSAGAAEANSEAEVFVRASEPIHGAMFEVRGIGGDGQPLPPVRRAADAGEASATIRYSRCDGLCATLAGDGGATIGQQAFWVRWRVAKIRVALLGRDNPLLRRFVSVCDDLELTGSAGSADVAIVNGASPPAGLPALVFDPPAAPDGWRKDDEIGPLQLASLDVAADDVVMKHVDFQPVVVRKIRPWIAGDAATQPVLASYRKEAVIVRDAAAPGRPKRIWVAFDAGQANTNFGLDPAFVIFLSNAMADLKNSAVGSVSGEYTSVSPLRADGVAWRRLCGVAVPADGAKSPLPWPGIYRDEAGKLHAVNAIGLKAGSPAVAPRQVVERLPLPEPVHAGKETPLWPIFAVAAGLLWLLGWTVRARESRA